MIANLATIKPSEVTRIFDLARTMENPINLSIGEPDFDIPGPGEIIQHMTTLQQYSFACAPSFAQKAATKALDYDVSELIEGYRRKRDLVYEGLREKYTVQKPRGAFYTFPEAKGEDSWKFVEKAIENNLFIVPGSVFSTRNT